LRVDVSTVTKKASIENLTIKSFVLERSKMNSDFLISDCTFEKIKLHHFRNTGSSKFYNCLPIDNSDSVFNISHSNLGKSEFVNFNFSGFSKFNINDSILIDCIFLNCIWSDKLTSFSLDNNNNYILTTDTVKFKNLRELYKQIKYAVGKQGDVVQESYFHGLEMNCYDKSLKWNEGFWTKLILKLSYWTSNYGQSILLPVLWMASWMSILYGTLFVMHATPYTTVDLSFDGFCNYLASFLNFINPLHKLEVESISSKAKILDALGRFSSSYLIYNFIRASRRFVK
jgi:hypothetical protein